MSKTRICEAVSAIASLLAIDIIETPSLGIAQTSLALLSLKRCFAESRHKPMSKTRICEAVSAIASLLEIAESRHKPMSKTRICEAVSAIASLLAIAEREAFVRSQNNKQPIPQTVISTNVETSLCRLTTYRQKQDAEPLAGHGNLSASCGEPKNKCRKRPKSMLFERSELLNQL